jgi:hypothetical protein
MTELEATLVEKIHNLDDQQKQKVLEYVESLQPKPFDFKEWLRQVREFKAQLREEYGEDYVVGTQQLLDELRDEASNPRL